MSLNTNVLSVIGHKFQNKKAEIFLNPLREVKVGSEMILDHCCTNVHPACVMLDFTSC